MTEAEKDKAIEEFLIEIKAEVAQDKGAKKELAKIKKQRAEKHITALKALATERMTNPPSRVDEQRSYKELPFFIVEYYDFEKLVNEAYDWEYDYSFVEDYNAHNGSCFMFVDISDYEELTDYQHYEIVKWLHSTPTDMEYYGVENITPVVRMGRILLTDLCIRGYIPSGNYLIRAFW